MLPTRRRAQEAQQEDSRATAETESPPTPIPSDSEAFEVEALRRMTPEAKLAVMRGLIRQAYSLKMAGIHSLHPALYESEAWARARDLVGGDRS